LLKFRGSAFAASSPAAKAALRGRTRRHGHAETAVVAALGSLEQGAACGGLGHPGAGLCLRSWSGPGIAHFSSSTKIPTIGL